MSTSDKLKILFEAAMDDSTPAHASRMAPLPRNPNGSAQPLAMDSTAHHDSDHFNPREEMLNRLNQMKQILTQD